MRNGVSICAAVLGSFVALACSADNPRAAGAGGDGGRAGAGGGQAGIGGQSGAGGGQAGGVGGGQAGSAGGGGGASGLGGAAGSAGTGGTSGQGGIGGAAPVGAGGSAGGRSGAGGLGGTAGAAGQGGASGRAGGGGEGTAGNGAFRVLAGDPGSRPARLNDPMGIAADGAGNLFVSDSSTIRKVVQATGDVTTFAGAPGEIGSADGIGLGARFAGPDGVASDGAGNLFIADTSNHVIRKIVLATGAVTTLAGAPDGSEYGNSGSADGTGAEASFRFPDGLACDGAGNLYVADTGNNTIRKIVIATGAVTTLAGAPAYDGDLTVDGTGPAARFSNPNGVAFDGAGNLFVTDYLNQTLRKIVIATGAVTTFAGAAGEVGSADGRGATARFNGPSAIASDGAGNLYVAETGNNMIRKIVIATRAVTTLAGASSQGGAVDGLGASARFFHPYGLALDGAGNLYVADSDNHSLRKIVLATGGVTTLSGSASEIGNRDGTGAGAGFNNPASIASDGAGNLFVADSAHNRIRKVVLATGAVTTLAGAGWPGAADGPAADASFSGPAGLASDGAGNLFVADTGNSAIRKIVIATGAVTTLAGAAGQPGATDGIGAAASFNGPAGLASDGGGNLFVADTGNNAIRKIVIATGAVTTVAGLALEPGVADGIGAAARFTNPYGVASDGGGSLYVADTGSSTLRKVVVATGAVTTLAGTPRQPGAADGIGTAATFSYPYGVASDGAGNLYVADTGNSVLRKVALQTAAVSTVIGPGSLDTPYGVLVLPAGQIAITAFLDNALLIGGI